MKLKITTCLSLAYSLTSNACLAAAAVAALTVSEPIVVDKGPHHTISRQTTQRTFPSGRVQTDYSFVHELAVGLHYREQTQDGWVWADSSELIEPSPNGAIAQHGQIKAWFAANINTPAAIQVQAENGDLLASHVLGIAYTSVTTGESVLIAEVHDSIGEIVPPNRIIYRNFCDGVLADVILTYTRFGVEQDVRILENLPPPEHWNLDSRFVRLEIFSELINPPVPVKTVAVLDSVINTQGRAALPQFTDETLDFPNLRYGAGRAIDLNGTAVDANVSKSWTTISNRTYLIEAVEYPAVRAALENLPKREARNGSGPGNGDHAGGLEARSTTGHADGLTTNLLVRRKFPSAPQRTKEADVRPMRTAVQSAKANSPSKGLLIDWLVTLNGGFTNFTALSEVTYKISGPCTFYQTNTIRGGAIFKFDHDSANPYLEFNGTIVCDTSPTFPAVFTAVDDSTMGYDVGAGAITGYYATTALRSSAAVAGDLHDLRFKFAATAIKWTGGTNRFSNLQIINCSNGVQRISASTAPVHNLLASHVGTLFLGNNSTIDAEHVTASDVGTLLSLTGSPATVALTNSILVNVTNSGTGTLAADYLATNNSFTVTGLSRGFSPASPLFQTSVGGQFYLASNSILRGAGTTNLATNLLAELSQHSSDPPIYLTNTLQSSMTLNPVVARGNAAQPTIGYGYAAALDYIVSNFKLSTNVLLTITNGTTIGVDYSLFDGLGTWGIIFDSARLASIGTATAPNRFLRAHCVQENSSGNYYGRSMFYDSTPDGDSEDPIIPGWSEAHFRFTEFSSMSEDGYTVDSGEYWSKFEWSHCKLQNMSQVIVASSGGQVYGMTNNVFESASMAVYGDGASFALHLRNNLFRNYALHISSGTTNCTVRDNLFDTVDLADYGAAMANGNNVYWQTTNLLTGGVTNLILTNLTYAVGPLSRYYQPTNNTALANAGSRSADSAQLFHFCAAVDQRKETNSIVDVGPHWIAYSGGAPVDSDGDSHSDAEEDSNGNGVFDAGETSWTDPSPVMSLTTPTNGAVFYFSVSTNITLTAHATDNGSVTNVEFFSGTTKVAQTNGGSSGNFTIVWTNVTSGTYSLTARATDNLGAPTISGVVNITVDTLPSVSVSAPGSGAYFFTAPTNVTISATASDADGTVTNVAFYVNGTNLLGQVAASPYTLVWSNVIRGGYSLTAKAFDNLGGATTSAPVQISVNGALDFGTNKAYVTFGNNTNLGLKQFTLECWFKRNGTGGVAATGNGGMSAIPLITKGCAESDGSNVDMNYFLGIATNVLGADFEDYAGGTNHPIFGVTTISNGVWYHAAASYNATNWQLFLNGGLEAQVSVGQTLVMTVFNTQVWARRSIHPGSPPAPLPVF